MSRTRTITGAGVIATAALVLIFGNQAVTEWVARHANTGSLLDWFLHRLTWPSWVLGPRDGSGAAFRSMLSQDLRALFLIAFVAVILALVSKGISSGGAAFFLGWASVVFASALAGFLTAFLLADASVIGALTAADAGSAYGLFVGWIVGILTGTAKRGT